MNPQPGIPSSDRELAEAVLRDGEERAFRTLYRRHSPRVYQLALRLLGGDVREAEDVTQETWLRAIGALERFRWEAAFGTWLGRIAVHVAKDALRRRGRGREDLWDPELEFETTGPIPAQSAAERLATRIDLERAIALLPDGYRAVLVLHDVEGWPHESIASELDISVGTSKSQLHRARRSLRALLVPAAEEPA